MRIVKGLFIFLFGGIVGLIGGFASGFIVTGGFICKYSNGKYFKQALVDKFQELLYGRRPCRPKHTAYKPKYMDKTQEFIFKKKEDADDFLDDILNAINEYSNVSIEDAISIALIHNLYERTVNDGVLRSYYGWDTDHEYAISEDTVPEETPTGKWRVVMPPVVDIY